MLDRRRLLKGALLALAGTASLAGAAEAQPYGPPP
ncbi:MAG: twin-arginine translocation signal domain-containing protein, partial [Xanthomonas perforans]|nr:twin-arginine translocation signal domain-containing protein [Xanthomonas perforans]